jgi:hypothetical protein
MNDKLLEQYLELRAVLYLEHDDEATLEGYGNHSFQLTSGELSGRTLHKIEKEGFYFFISQGKLVMSK